MSAPAYLREQGQGRFAGALVPDLLPSRDVPVDVLLVLESPHVAEVAAGHPLAGAAGIQAWAYLTDSPTTATALGRVIAERGSDIDHHVGIINVSRVPLQRQAVAASVLSDSEWRTLESLRSARGRTVHRMREPRRTLADILLDALEDRLEGVTLSPSATVAVAGAFAQMFWRSLDAQPARELLHVPHPARDQWRRASGSAATSLGDLRRRLSECGLIPAEGR